MSKRSDRERRLKRVRTLRVGWSALIVIGAGVVYAIVVTVTGRLDYGTAGFQAGVVLAGTMLGLAIWDLAVAWLARDDAPALALPERIRLPLPRRIVPAISPLFFGLGILIGHQYWH